MPFFTSLSLKSLLVLCGSIGLLSVLSMAVASETADACKAEVDELTELSALKAVDVCETAAAAEPAVGEIRFDLALAYQQAGRDADAMASFAAAGDAGHAMGYYHMGRALIFGIGVMPNLPVGIAALEQAEAGGVVEAKSMLGALNMGYPGIPVSYEFGLKRLNEAAELGDISAYLGLGTAYEYGQGVEKNLETARAWFQKAAEAGDPIGAGEAARIRALIGG